LIDKKKVKHGLNNLQRLKTWQLLILLVLLSFLAATFLRLNNVGMIERREAVYSADEQGDEEAITSRLYDLQRYVSSHMNTDLGRGVYLEYSYKRDVQEAYDKAAVQGNVYKKAQEVCAPRYTSWSYAYIQCTVDELQKYPSANELKLPISDSYLHSFASPVWSPDFAGFSVFVCVVILMIILLRITGVIILKILLKKHYKTI